MAVKISLSITQNSQNIENNTSSVTVKCKASWTYGSWNATGQCTGSITIDGTKYSFSGIKFNTSQTTTGSKVVMSKTVTITHNDDGTKFLECSASFDTYISAGTVKASASQTLDTIARASQPSCVTYPDHTQNVGDFGSTISIHMNRKSASFTHTVRYEFGSKSGTIATGVGTGTTWKIPLDFMDLLPADTSGSGTIYVDTYNGSTKIGTKYCGFTATVPASVKPTCTITLEDITGVDDIYGSPVKGLSKIKVTVNATKAYSSPIKTYSISVNGAKYSGATATTEALQSSGSVPVTVSVTDDRGRTGSASYTMSVQNYTPPVVTNLTAARCNQDGSANRRGAYIKVTFSAAISSMGSKNTALYYLRYKKTSETSESRISLTALTNKYAPANYTYIFAAATGNSYDVIIEAVDRHNASNPSEKSVKAPTAAAIFSWRGFKTSSGKQEGAGIGKVPEKPNTLEVGWNAEFDRSLVQKGNRYSYQPEAFSGEKGYTLLAVINLNTLNVNAPIVFKINRRGAGCPMTVYVRFASSSTSTDPDLASITYEGDNYGVFMIKETVSRWKLYVDNTSGWSNPCLQEWFTTDNQMARITVEFLSEQVSSLPSPWYRATPVISQSILDAFYPVGYILLLYSHADPNAMYPGTKWVRIYGAFPWFTDANGEIGLTGGERTVTLNVNQIPAHSHGSVYSQHATGTKDKAWYTTSGSSVAYGTVETGGGQAHNNMPPYIQISAWRRTE